jgi:Flp pilus assembly pilin Flp
MPTTNAVARHGQADDEFARAGRTRFFRESGARFRTLHGARESGATAVEWATRIAALNRVAIASVIVAEFLPR